MGSYKSRLSLGTACLALALDSVVYHSIGVSSPFKATDFELPTQAIQIFLLPFVAAVIDGLIGGERTMIFGFVVTMSGIAFGALGWNFGILSIHQAVGSTFTKLTAASLISSKSREREDFPSWKRTRSFSIALLMTPLGSLGEWNALFLGKKVTLVGTFSLYLVAIALIVAHILKEREDCDHQREKEPTSIFRLVADPHVLWCLGMFLVRSASSTVVEGHLRENRPVIVTWAFQKDLATFYLWYLPGTILGIFFAKKISENFTLLSAICMANSAISCCAVILTNEAQFPEAMVIALSCVANFSFALSNVLAVPQLANIVDRSHVGVGYASAYALMYLTTRLSKIASGTMRLWFQRSHVDLFDTAIVFAILALFIKFARRPSGRQ